MNIKLNNKGFTLVELLAVIVILVTVSFVAVGGISNSLQNRDVKECKEQQQLAVSAAKMYFSLDGKHIDKVNEGVTIWTLKNSGYIKDGDNKVNLLNDSDRITFNDTDSVYLYNGGVVGESCS